MKLELKHLAGYLPYGLKCQYEGIVNGSEISKQRKEFQKENEPFTNWAHYEPIAEIKGLKIAPLKTIRVYKNYWVATCGIYNNGQKGFYNGVDLMPILRPLSDLTKEDWNSVFVDSDIDKILSIYQSDRHLGCVEYYLVNILLSHHFDIYGLIEKGLAIDINTLKE